MFQYEIIAESGFMDLGRYPRRLSVGEVVTVSENQYNQMKGSDPDSIRLLRKIAPNPKASKQFLDRVKGKEDE